MRTFLLLLVLIAIASFPFISNWYYGVHKDAYETAQIESIVEKYIEKNPEKILESVSRYRLTQFEKQQQQRAQEIRSAITKHKNEIFDFNYPSRKVPDAKTTVVELFDASCGYCKIASQMLVRAMNDYPNANYILRNLPILGRNSMVAARYDLGFSLFIREKGLSFSKYLEFYLKLMDHSGQYDPEAILEMVSSLGFSKGEFQSFFEKNADKIDEMINKTVELATKLQLDGTPVFIVDEQIIQGANETELREALEKAK
ncbi:DSBA-like thioredoxin domain protein [Neorickettsia helminthoeca str. Oregon]|uniref:DSBA-like thioredoxin domain protein n=1 Tax=Neorickettsia helminthoeca str. Oregon TaxID=1286528 RepID=X5H505_9RICK|nr:DsbA family protein [Neorickettsia helminthoeca]AHX11778.1 DSBA-like thioredoxin domain protein [Neorickettsia helminthoeca str. Oregon]